MQDNHVNMTLVSPAMQKEQEVSSRKETGMVRPNDFGSDIRNIDTLRFYIRADFRSRGVQEPFLRAVFADPIVRFTFLMRVLEYANGRGFSKTLLLPLRYWYRRLSIRARHSRAGTNTGKPWFGAARRSAPTARSSAE
jgi:hypothetical protein